MKLFLMLIALTVVVSCGTTEKKTSSEKQQDLLQKRMDSRSVN